MNAIGTGSVIWDYRITSIDATYILDNEGQITYKDTGVTSTETFERQVAKLRNGGDNS